MAKKVGQDKLRYSKLPMNCLDVFGNTSYMPGDYGMDENAPIVGQLIPDTDFNYLLEQDGFADDVKVKWQELRQNQLSNEALLTELSSYQQELLDSGVIYRVSRMDKQGAAYNALIEFINERMKMLDQYYEGL
ncbi:MAG: hypothetical protein PHP50_09120 [Lachnospiraceae bacterium]|nr:hypothetical protein [Lachnospiraceae bacterium]